MKEEKAAHQAQQQPQSKRPSLSLPFNQRMKEKKRVD